MPAYHQVALNLCACALSNSHKRAESFKILLSFVSSRQLELDKRRDDLPAFVDMMRC